MNVKIFKQAMCVVLALMMFGCSSTYDLTFRSAPSGVAVDIGTDLHGRTPCNLQLPTNSDLIRDKQIYVRYTLDDGRQLGKYYDLRNYDTPGPDIGGFVGECIAVPGVLMLNSALSDDEEDEDDFMNTPFYYTSEMQRQKEEEEDDDIGTKAASGLVGAGFVATGALVKGVFGRKDGDKYKYEIHEDFEGLAALPEN